MLGAKSALWAQAVAMSWYNLKLLVPCTQEFVSDIEAMIYPANPPKGFTCPNVSPFAIGMIYCRAGLGSRYTLLKFSVAHFHLHRYDVSLICNAKSPLCNFLNSIRFTMGRPLKT